MCGPDFMAVHHFGLMTKDFTTFLSQSSAFINDGAKLHSIGALHEETTHLHQSPVVVFLNCILF